MKKKIVIILICFLTINTTIKANFDTPKSDDFDLSKLSSHETKLWDGLFGESNVQVNNNVDFSQVDTEIVYLGNSKNDTNISKSEYYRSFIDFDVLEVMKNIGALIVRKSENDSARNQNYFAKVDNEKEILEESEDLNFEKYSKGQKNNDALDKKVNDGFVPNDPSFMSQFELIDSKANLVWEYGRGEGVKIGIADSGFSNLYSDQMRDIDRERLLDVKYIGAGDNACYDTISQHGTSTTSVLGAAKTNNGEGIASMAHESIIQPYVFSYKCDSANSGYNTADLVRVFDQAIEDKIDFLNMSWLTSGKSIAVELAILRSLSSDVVTVVSRGNSGSNTTVYPVCYEGVVGVLNLNRNLTLNNSSSYGDCGSSTLSMIGTYGSNIHALDINGVTITGGTSIAAPFLTSSLAVLKSVYPQMRNQDIVSAVYKSATDLGEKGYDQKFGYGALNIFNTIDYLNNGNHSLINYIDITNGKSIHLAKGEDFSLDYQTYPKNLTQSSLKWTSSDASIATVDNKGTVSAIREGVTVVSVKAYGGASRSIKVYVGKPSLQGLTIGDKDVELILNSNHQFSVTANPSDAELGNLKWSSSDQSIASIDQNGYLTTLNVGIVTIKVETEDGQFSDTATVSVKRPALDKITLNQKVVNMFTGENHIFTVTGSPSEAEIGNLIWSSSDSSIASVDQNGKVTGYLEGEVTIKVETEDGLISDSSKVIVNKPLLEGIQFVTPEVTLNIGSKYLFEIIVLPSEAEIGNLIWSISDSSIATIDQQGNLHALKSGSVVVKVETENGTHSDYATVFVTRPSLEKISISEKEVVLMPNSNHSFSVIGSPSEAELGNLIWSSSDTSIATIDQQGNLIALKSGFVIVKVETEDGNYSDYAHVTITRPSLERITISDKEVVLGINSKHKFTVSGSPSEAFLGNLVWSSSDSSIATINQEGNLVAKKVGTVIVKVETEDGLYSDYAHVTITRPSLEKITISDKNVVLNVDSKYKFTVIGSPSEAILGKLIWSSSDSSIVRVDQSGQITAIKPGEVTIKVETENGLFKDNSTVRVTKQFQEPWFHIVDEKIDIKVGDSYQLKYSVDTSVGDLGLLSWNSSNPSILRVDQNGKIKALKSGKVTIKLSSQDGLFLDEIFVEIKEVVKSDVQNTNPNKVLPLTGVHNQLRLASGLVMLGLGLLILNVRKRKD